MTEKKLGSCRECRRVGKKLFLKGERCSSVKCAITKRNYPPGAHGATAHRRLTPFGLQLQEKQKAKEFYGLRERQFKNYFQKAVQKKGDTGEIFLSYLERRLDNLIYRMGFASSRSQARQLVTHGHFTVNGKKLDIPSYQVKPNDVIVVRGSSVQGNYFKNLLAQEAHSAPLGWVNVDRKKLTGKVVDFPKMEDLGLMEFDIKSIVEFYSK